MTLGAVNEGLAVWTRRVIRLLRARLLTAALGAPLLLLTLYVGGWWYALGIGALAVGAVSEALRLVGLAHRGDLRVGSAALMVALHLVLVAGRSPGSGAAALASLLFGFLAVRQVLAYPRISFAETAAAWLSICYVGLAFAHFPALRGLTGGLSLTVTVFVLTWTFDTVAYFAGMRFGRRRLAPRLSPGKSWEGAIAGSTAVLTLAALPLPFFAVNAAVRLALGLVVVVFGQLGDLFESALKRAAQVKDSGGILPGHGGILDRFDSLMFTVPAAYYLVMLWPWGLGL